MGKVGQIAIHLLEGTPKGLRLVEFGNWAGRGVVAPMAAWQALMGRMELDLGGIYFLKRPASAIRSGQILVGTAMVLRPALEAIAADPTLSDVSEVMVFVRRWGWQEADELIYLANEFRVISLSKPALVMHGQLPPSVRLRPEKRVELESDLDHVVDLLLTCGFDWEAIAIDTVAGFEIGEVDNPSKGGAVSTRPPATPETKPTGRPRGRPAKDAPKTAAKALPKQPDLFVERVPEAPVVPTIEPPIEAVPVIGKYHLEKKDIQATMDIIDGRFVVRKGSQAKRNAYPSMAENYRKIRARLVEEGVLVESGADHYVFTRDYAFDSASTSASVVNGAQTAGPRAWYDENNVSLRGIPNDHHSLHETHRKPKDESLVEENDDGDISASFKFDEQDDVLEKVIDTHETSPKTELPAAPVLAANERLTSPESREPKREDTPKHTVESHPETSAPVGNYRIIGKQVKATMDVVPGGFLVRRGSQALQVVSHTISKHYLTLRSDLIASGVLVKQGDTYFEFTKDYLFSSISAASSIVLGRQTDGWISWRDMDGNFYNAEG